MAEYHKREGDPNAVISTWKDDKRIITFSVPLSGVPDVVKTAIGGGWPLPASGLQASFKNIRTLVQFPNTFSNQTFCAGCSTLTIQETQQREWAADGSLSVKSDPILDIVGGSKFTTSAEFMIENSAAQPGCEVSH